MKSLLKEAILSWISCITSSNIHSVDDLTADVLVGLIQLSGDTSDGSGFGEDNIQKIGSFLNFTFDSGASKLFDIRDAIENKSNDEEIFGLCLIILLACLQSSSRQAFMNAALELDLNTQTLIFHLIKEPLVQLSAHHSLDRNIVLSRFREPLPISDSTSNHTTQPLPTSVLWPTSCRLEYADDVPSDHSEFPQFKVPTSLKTKHLELQRDLSKNHTSDFVQLALSQESKSTKTEDTIRPKSAVDFPQCTNSHHECTRPNSGPVSRQRPTELPMSSTHEDHHPLSLSFDTTDTNGSQKVYGLLASPLTSLRSVLDSPSLIQKTQLRESERERRRLLVELDKERAYRDEMENLVTSLRQQVDEARIRATDADSRVARLSRELAAFKDQGDELTDCRAELVLREDEISSLKQRLNGFQDLMSHCRKLEIENSNLHQECADYRLKVDELLDKLKEIKERRIMCTEVETLRSKLRDVEAQLAQQLMERQTIEQDTRRQQEMLAQLKVHQSLAEKRQALQNGVHNGSEILKPASLHGGLDEIEVDTSLKLRDETGLIGSQQDVHPVDNGITDALQNNLASGENLGAILESELKSAQSCISKLKLESQLELGTTKELLDYATSRLKELEDRLASFQFKPDQIEVALQTDEIISLDADEAEIEALAISEFTDRNRTLPSDAYETSIDDRRSLSAELVRLHEELYQATDRERQLGQELANLQKQNLSLEESLRREATLAARAQQNWASSEQACRDAEEQLAVLRSSYARELESIRNSLLPPADRSHVDAASNAAQLEALRMDYEKECSELKHKLTESAFEKERLESARLRLAERNADLERELDTTRTLISTLVQQNSSNRLRRSKPSGRSKVVPKSPFAYRCTSDSLEDWLENGHDQHNLVLQNDSSTQSLTRLSLCSHDTHPLSYSDRPHKSNSPRFDGGYNSRHSHSRSKRRSADVDQIARLTSRTVALEQFAVELKQNVDQQCLQNVTNSVAQSAVVNPSCRHRYLTPRKSDTSLFPPETSCDASVPQNGSVCRLPAQLIHSNIPPLYPSVQHGLDLDTDADSPAYTDLSQVSPVSQAEESVVCAQRIPPIQDSKLKTTCAGGTCVLSSSRTATTAATESNVSLDPSRIAELHLRNRLQPLHLRSSYPLETQVLDSTDIVGALGHLTSTSLEQDTGHNSSLRNDTILREVEAENVKQTSKLQSATKLRENLEHNSASLLPAGYHPFPKDLHSMTEALIAASDDPKAMMAALTTRLNQTSLTLPNLLKSNKSNHSYRKQCREVDSLTFRRDPNSAQISRTKAAVHISSDDENFIPSQAPTKFVSNKTKGLFARPCTPKGPQATTKSKYVKNGDQASSSSSLFSDGASSVRSSKSSIAFEIPNEHKTAVIRRLPTRLKHATRNT